MRQHLKIGLCIIVALLMCGSAAAWVDGYQYRQPITLTGGSSGAQSDYQMNYTVTYDSDMQPDFDDLRFTELDGNTLLDAFLESKTDGVSAVIYVETDTPADAVESDIYMYYGNASAASDWDGTGTYISFFNGSSTGWTEVDPNSHISFANDRLEWAGLNRGEDAYVYQSASVNCDLVIEYTFKHTSTPHNSVSCMGMATDMLDDYNNVDNAVKSYGGYYSGVTYHSSADKRVSDSGTGGSEICFVVGTQYWATTLVDRSGNLITKIYSDSARTSQVGSDSSVSLSDLPATLQYSMMLASLNTGGTHAAVATDGWLDDYTVRKYASGPPTYAFGSEQSPPVDYVSYIFYWNNVTGESDHVSLKYGTTVLFNATADGSVTWSWTLDGVDQSSPYDNYTHTFTDGFGYYAVTVNATHANGTDLHTWGVWENIETTAETIPTFTDTSYQMLLDSIDYPPNMEDFGKAMAHPFVQMVGVIFYLFIFGIPLLMMYIRQDNMTLPTTLLLLFGSIIIFMLPPQWQIIAGALMTLGFVGILFKLYKERER